MYKVLIVDDEELIRKSIMRKLNKMQIDFAFVKDASNIDNAYMLILEDKPDIIICDIRIGNSFGFELITKLADQGIETEIIIISGYNDFNYAKKSLSLHVNDYLLKPINFDDLQVAILKSISNIRQKQNNRDHAEIASIVSDSRNNWRILNEYKDESLNNPFLEKHPSKLSNPIFQSLFIYTPIIEEHLFLKTIANTLDRTRYWVREKNAFLMKINEQEYHILFLFDQMQLLINQKKIMVLANTIHQVLSTISLEKPTIGLARDSQHPYNSMKDSRFIMKHRILFPGKEIITYDDIAVLKDSDNLEILDVRQLVHLIKQNDIQRINEFLNKVCINLKSCGFGYRTIERVFQKLLSILGESFQDSVYISTLYQDLKVYEYDNLESLFTHIKVIYSKVLLEENLEFGTDYRQKRVFLFKSYIDDNFTNTISLQEYCSEQNINVSYLSKEFKNLIGVNYQNYLLELRIGKAKEYLKKTNEKIGEISLLCGFQDQHHFSRIFKKIVGVSPRDFRIQIPHSSSA